MTSHPNAVFSELLVGNGYIHKRKVFSRSAVSLLIDVGNWLYLFLENPLPNNFGHTKASEYLWHTNREWSGLQMDSIFEFARQQSPEMFDRFTQATTHVVDTILPLLGKDWVWRSNGSYYRRLAQPSSNVAWHSDAEAASTLAAGIQAVTVWVPLVEVGTQMPSLEFVCGSQRKMRQPPTAMPNDRIRPEDWVVSEIGGDRFAPRAKPRDALMFDEFTLHRTQILPGSAPGRTSCEFRFAKPGAPRQIDDVSPYPDIPKFNVLEAAKGIVVDKIRQMT